MVTRVQSLQQYMQLNQRETIQRLVGTLGGKAGLPVATNDIRRVASMLHGEIHRVGDYSIRDAAIVMPRLGLPKLFVATERTDYRRIFETAWKNMGISIGRSVAFDVDHALAKTLALGKFEQILLNPINRLPNRSFGSFEKGSTDRVFDNNELEIASITEALKIGEVAPATQGNLAEDCLIGVINARGSGLISKNEIKPMLDTIRNSHNNLVLEAYAQVKPDFEKAAKTIE